MAQAVFNAGRDRTPEPPPGTSTVDPRARGGPARTAMRSSELYAAVSAVGGGAQRRVQTAAPVLPMLSHGEVFAKDK